MTFIIVRYMVIKIGTCSLVVVHMILRPLSAVVYWSQTPRSVRKYVQIAFQLNAMAESLLLVYLVCSAALSGKKNTFCTK